MSTGKSQTAALKQAFQARQEEINPCLKEQKLSLKCMSDNGFNKEMCQHFFDNYNECKKFWNAVRVSRIEQRIDPPMPGTKEREAILEKKRLEDEEKVARIKQYQEMLKEKARRKAAQERHQNQ